LFSVFWIAILAWSLLAFRLLRELRARHPLVFATLARGGIRCARQEIGLLRFLWVRRDRFLDDPGLSRLCRAMRALLVSYVLFFLILPGLALS
jgi:hypothetical protein